MAKKKKAKRRDSKSQDDKGSLNRKNTNEEIIDALKMAKGMVRAAARLLNVSARSIYSRMKDHPEIAEALEEAREFSLDNAELRLQEAIDRGDAWAICFFLKCQGKTRGYIERVEHDIGGRIDYNVQVSVAQALDELESKEEFLEYARQSNKNRDPGLLRDERLDPDGSNGSTNGSAKMGNGRPSNGHRPGPNGSGQ